MKPAKITECAIIISMIVCLFLPQTLFSQIFNTTTGKAKFTSEAPLELIKAESNKMVCLIDTKDRRFAFSVPVESFEGFNSPLQKEHFRDNYLETDKFKAATFQGKIIEEVDLTQNGVYNIRAKGKVTIHGVEKEMIIKGKITVKDGSILVDSTMDVPLEDFNIKVPRVVNQKIAQVIKVHVESTLTPKK